MTPKPAWSAAEVATFLGFADRVLAAPPAQPWIERHPGRGRLVLRFAFPIAMVQGANDAIRHRPGWALAKDRAEILSFMGRQLVAQAEAQGVELGILVQGRRVIRTWPAPLGGRPMLRAIRFSVRPSDDTSAWWKTVGDCLLPPTVIKRTKVIAKRRRKVTKRIAGLGVLRADSPDALETRFWCEPSSRGSGGALVEVWSG